MKFERGAIYQLDRFLKLPIFCIGLLIAIILFGIWHIATNTIILESPRWQNIIHFSGFALLASISTSFFRNGSDNFTKFCIDFSFGVVILLAALWVGHAETLVYKNNVEFTWSEWLASIIVIIGAIELTRRLTGWVISIIIIIALLYVSFLGKYLPSIFFFGGLPLENILFRSMYNDEGMFGTIASISSNYIALFMIFGGFLIVSGASDFVVEFSKVIAGKFRGGAAFMAVISSALTGTISGSAIANTASTGIITIPLMKKSGFRAQFAGGVEAAASTGGQLMPPIMGAGAFVMAANTQIPYTTIITVSIIPAILYFFAVAMIIRIESVKYNVGGDNLLVEKIDKNKFIGGAVNFLLPLSVMIYLLISGVSPNYAACYAILSLIIVSWFTPNKMGLKKIIQAIQMGVKGAVMTAILLTTVGLIINVIATTGLGNAFSLMIVQWSNGYILIALLLIAIASLVLGMGLPVTAAYIILSILSAPALAGMIADAEIINMLQQGISDPVQLAIFSLVDTPLIAKLTTGMSAVEATNFVISIPIEIAATIRPQVIDETLLTGYLLTAHLIIFWLSQDSNVTPPVCLVAFTAAGIAKSKPMATGFESWKIAKGLYIVPILFAYTPLITGQPEHILWIGFCSLFGIYAINSIVQKFAESPLPIWSFPIFAILALGAFWHQNFDWLNISVNAVCCFCITLLVWTLKKNHQNTSNAST